MSGYRTRKVHRFLGNYWVVICSALVLGIIAPFFTFLFGGGLIISVLERHTLREIIENSVFFCAFATAWIWGVYIFLKKGCPYPTMLVIEEEHIEVKFLWKRQIIPWEGIEGIEPGRDWISRLYYNCYIYVKPGYGKNFILWAPLAREIKEIWKAKMKARSDDDFPSPNGEKK